MEKIKQIIAKVFELEINDINDDFSIENCENWDSITHLTLIQSIEDEYGIELELMETLEMVSIEKIYSIIKSKLI